MVGIWIRVVVVETEVERVERYGGDSICRAWHPGTDGAKDDEEGV